MAYLSEEQLQAMGFKKLGKNVRISDKAAIYNPEQMELGDHVRIDDFCVVSGNLSFGRFIHVTPMCLVAGGIPGIVLEDFCTLAYGVKVFSQSDDYSGQTLVNSNIPKGFKNEKFAAVHLHRQVIVGAGAVIMPGVNVAEGCAIGAMALVTRSTEAWGVYAGTPAVRLKDRSRDLLSLEKQFLEEFEK